MSSSPTHYQIAKCLPKTTISRQIDTLTVGEMAFSEMTVSKSSRHWNEAVRQQKSVWYEFKTVKTWYCKVNPTLHCTIQKKCLFGLNNFRYLKNHPDLYLKVKAQLPNHIKPRNTDTNLKPLYYPSCNHNYRNRNLATQMMHPIKQYTGWIHQSVFTPVLFTTFLLFI